MNGMHQLTHISFISVCCPNCIQVQATQGSYDLAYTSYCQSIELKPSHNVRALYGILYLFQCKGLKSGSVELHRWVERTLLNHYARYAPHLSAMVESCWKPSKAAALKESDKASEGKELKEKDVDVPAASKTEQKSE